MFSAKGTSRNQGFTLIELLIVIAIIAILVTIVVAIINPVRRIQHARNVVRVNDLVNIARVLEAYNVEHGTYPTEYYYDTSRGCIKLELLGNWWEDPRFNNNDWSGGDCDGETLDEQVSPALLPKDPTNRDYFVYGYNAAKIEGGDDYVGYSLETFFEGRGIYRICGGDWKNTWIILIWPSCGINNPDP